MNGNFDFSTESYEEPVVKELAPFMSTSGYVKGNITKCEYNSRNNSVDIELLGTQNKQPVFANKMKLFLENKDGTKSTGFYLFMSICKIVGLNKVEQDETTGEYKDLIGKEIVLGIQLKFSPEYTVPLKNIKSVHDPVTGQTLSEKINGKKAESIHVKLNDWIEKPKYETTVKEDFAPPAEEPPVGFGGSTVDNGAVPSQGNIPLDKELPF